MLSVVPLFVILRKHHPAILQTGNSGGCQPRGSTQMGEE
jgi:hypothetical protein